MEYKDLHKIEKGIPIPKIKLTRGHPSKYPFIEMEVGDSFEFDPEFTKDKIKKARDCCRDFQKRVYNNKRKFVAAQYERAIRVWREK